MSSLPGMAHEQLEQRELGAGEVHGLAVAGDAPAGEVDLESSTRTTSAPGVGCGTRRSAARIRASSSSVSNGFVT